MITIHGAQHRFCDGVTRRSFLEVGGLALGRLSLPELLRAESASGSVRSEKAIIMIYLPGGPPHQDLFDLKPDAPSEIRGELKPIPTNVPGVQVCELLPRLARIMDKLVVIRSIVGGVDDHSAFLCVTGRRKQGQPQGGWPELGSVLSHLRGPAHPAVPPFVNLAPKMQHAPYNAGHFGFLGMAYAPFRPEGEARSTMALDGITLERLGERTRLLAAFDRFRRGADAGGLMEGMDAFHRQAFGVLTSSRLVEALDLGREDPRTLERYGRGTDRHQGDGAPRLMEQFLLARRLVEAGVRCVTVSFSFWDWHGGCFRNARENLPALDQGVSALVEDLHERGLEKEVVVVVWGEFGRTPRINKDAGRDHWPKVSCALLAGGGLRTGQVIGSTDRHAAEAKDRPVHFQEVFATLYHALGLDPLRTTVRDYSGRPHYLAEGHEPIREVV
ncbi:MAG: DUF1501 domain-containing protein [Planctomycetes bacterium]|nr:DUF1501 domain-containing protein [Planctomycetota bacterium]